MEHTRISTLHQKNVPVAPLILFLNRLNAAKTKIFYRGVLEALASFSEMRLSRWKNMYYWMVSENFVAGSLFKSNLHNTLQALEVNLI